MKPVAIVAAVVVGLLAVWWAVEMSLLKASRYRLAHGDGREHSFRRRDDTSARTN
jgi:hypothetical protein